ncbi:formin-I-like isoform X2 [Pseudophryne corroboree]|uniref:formin-I-like isoform X2 n=1 Tax=Pseudophryne corroboree TaxID=495146 RepID=UPI0030816D53
MQNVILDTADPLTIPQHNFTVYKHRYRWQKRILQIDFQTQMIYNIEKGTVRKHFPFNQIKSCKDNDGLRFVISFHGHQDYELEATCLEDKQNIFKIMSTILQSNSQMSTLRSFAKKHATSEVILEGLLELYDDQADKWVKYLVNVKRDKLVLYCSQQVEPEKSCLNLSDCSVSAETHNDLPTFSIQSNVNKYIFRIPLNIQTRHSEESITMRDDWVSVLQEFCLQSLLSPSLEGGQHTIEGLQCTQMDPHDGHKAFTADNKTENSLNIYEKLCTPNPSPQISDDTSSETENTKTSASNAASFQDQVPVFMPPPPLPIHLRTTTSNTPSKTKAFHWNIVPQEKISKSMWAQNSTQKKIDAQRILHQFQFIDVSAVSESDISKESNILLDKKIAHNFNIVLKSFNVKPEQLKEKLLIIRECDGGLSDKHLTDLRRYVPTIKDIKMYLNYKGCPSELHIVDQFMLQMCKIPDLCPRLDTLLAIRELPMYMKDLHPLLCQMIKACNQLLNSRAFLAVLSYILAMGNCLNENAGRGKAKGFQLSSLTKMSQLVSKEKRFTFLHALVEQIILQEPDLAKFSQELTEFEAVPGASIKGLNAEVDVLCKQLETINQYRKSFKAKYHKNSAREDQFLKDLKDIVEQYGTLHADLAKKTNEMKRLYSEVLQMFGEAEDQDSQELFGSISTFIKEFQNAYMDIRPSQ